MQVESVLRMVARAVAGEEASAGNINIVVSSKTKPVTTSILSVSDTSNSLFDRSKSFLKHLSTGKLLRERP